MAETLITCGSLHIDLANQRVWRDEKGEIRLTPKAFAVLSTLLQHAGHLVMKEELLQTVWPDTFVSEAALTVCIRELRRKFGDKTKTPQYIETVHRRGYRWLAPLRVASLVSGSTFQVSRFKKEANEASLETWNVKRGTLLVGRDTELTQLHQHFDKAMTGERQIVFVTGEPGIGKTALVEGFLKGVGLWALDSSSSPPQPLEPRAHFPEPGCWVAGGQCIEHFGAGEAYLPLLSALGELGQGPHRESLLATLRQYAPTWLMQLPSLATPEDRAAFQLQTFGATRERMLRELAELLEALTTNTPLVLMLEDLHWSDPSTLDALSFLARRRQLARLLVMGTYRPTEVLGNGHPLRTLTQDLAVHRQSVELPLPLLTEGAIEEYLTVRALSAVGTYSNTPLQTLAQQIHQRTSGNPLFMVNVVDNLLAHEPSSDGEDVQIQLNVPATIRQMIERQIDHLSSEEQLILITASAVGMEFAAATIASSLTFPVTTIEDLCANLARREHFVRPTSTVQWPDGTTSARYSFRHALYQEVLYDRVTPSRRQQVHQQVGERLEQGYGERATEIAAALAVHFEHARDYPRAVQYHGLAGQNALRRNAPQEASAHLTIARDLLNELPASVERNQQELPLQMMLGVALMNAKGYTAPEVERAYSRARTLCEELEDSPQIFPILVGLVVYHAVRGEFSLALSLSEHCLTLAQRIQDPALLLEAHRSMGYVLYHIGNHHAARSHIAQAFNLYDPQQHAAHAFLYGHEPGTFCLSYLASIDWYLGYPEQATKRVQEALAIAKQLAHPLTLLGALHVGTTLAIYARDPKAVFSLQQEEIATARQYDVPFYAMVVGVHEGWALAQQGKAPEAIPQIRQALDTISCAGFVMLKPTFLSFLSEAYSKAGDSVKALATITEALAEVERTGERSNEAELYRLKGTLTLEARGWGLEPSSSSPQAPSLKPQVPSGAEQEAEECFLKAINIARQQSAKSWELRATMSLVRLRQQQMVQSESRTTSHESRLKLAEAHQMLSEVYNWFTEGFETADLQDAKALLEALSH